MVVAMSQTITIVRHRLYGEIDLQLCSPVDPGDITCICGAPLTFVPSYLRTCGAVRVQVSAYCRLTDSADGHRPGCPFGPAAIWEQLQRQLATPNGLVVDLAELTPHSHSPHNRLGLMPAAVALGELLACADADLAAQIQRRLAITHAGSDVPLADVYYPASAYPRLADLRPDHPIITQLRVSGPPNPPPFPATGIHDIPCRGWIVEDSPTQRTVTLPRLRLHGDQVLARVSMGVGSDLVVVAAARVLPEREDEDARRPGARVRYRPIVVNVYHANQVREISRRAPVRHAQAGAA